MEHGHATLISVLCPLRLLSAGPYRSGLHGTTHDQAQPVGAQCRPRHCVFDVFWGNSLQQRDCGKSFGTGVSQPLILSPPPQLYRSPQAGHTQDVLFIVVTSLLLLLEPTIPVEGYRYLCSYGRQTRRRYTHRNWCPYTPRKLHVPKINMPPSLKWWAVFLLAYTAMCLTTPTTSASPIIHQCHFAPPIGYTPLSPYNHRYTTSWVLMCGDVHPNPGQRRIHILNNRTRCLCATSPPTRRRCMRQTVVDQDTPGPKTTAAHHMAPQHGHEAGVVERAGHTGNNPPPTMG